MVAAGDGRRGYRSALRDDQVRRTRRAVVAAATELFVERGFTATTIDAVAERAGVSRRTVFTAVGNKAALLKLAWDWSLVGDDEPVPMADREAVRRVQRQTSGAAAVRAWARMVRLTGDRAAPLGQALLSAADSDPDARALMVKVEAERREGTRLFARWLQDHGWLRDGLSVPVAADLLFVITDPYARRWLVESRGATPEAYQRWLARTASAAVL